MFLGKLYRKKRRLSLSRVHPYSQKPLVMTHWLPPTQNVPTREEDWARGVYYSHRAFCGCNDPIRHLASLAATLGLQPETTSPGNPGSSSTPASLRPFRALPAPPATPRPQPCGGRGGGDGRGDRRGDGGDGAGADLQEGDVQELLDILDDAE